MGGWVCPLAMHTRSPARVHIHRRVYRYLHTSISQVIRYLVVDPPEVERLEAHRPAQKRRLQRPLPLVLVVVGGGSCGDGSV